MIDGFLGFNNIWIKDSEQQKITFATKWGTFYLKRMSFGLSNVVSTFQRVVDHAFGPMINKIILVYLNDIIIFSKDGRDHLGHLKEMFKKCRAFSIYLNAKNSIFIFKEGKLLGHVVSKQAMVIEPKSVLTIRNTPLPSNKKAI